jgi:arylsulfatase A
MTPPNIILILADDMGYGDMSLFNAGRSQTPVLDRLAQDSLCLTQHYAASPVCNPSRACLLTGRYPHRTGSIDTFDHLGGERLCLRERTLADLLQRAGYATGLIGKWHNGTLGAAYHPTRRGFGEFFGFRGGWQYYFDSRLERNGVPFRLGKDQYLTDVLTDEAVAFLQRHRSQPFFLHLAYNCPHFPFEAPAADVAPFAATGQFSPTVAKIYGMSRNMDRNIRRVLETLTQLGLDSNTIVLFTSDNGPQLGGDANRFNCNFHGAKGLVYEGGIRLPLIARGPDGLPGRTSLDAMIHMSDWLPTLLAACALPLPDDHLPVDGWNILPVLRGESGKVNPRRFWQWNRYYPNIGSNAAMRDGDWKLVRPETPNPYRPEDGPMDERLRQDPACLTDIMPTPPRASLVYAPPLPVELYNLRQDPEERDNQAARQPERAARMLRELEAWFAQVEADRHQCPDAIFQ